LTDTFSLIDMSTSSDSLVFCGPVFLLVLKTVWLSLPHPIKAIQKGFDVARLAHIIPAAHSVEVRMRIMKLVRPELQWPTTSTEAAIPLAKLAAVALY
jgi:hypothetical protein